jgi:hypothetical protein
LAFVTNQTLYAPKTNQSAHIKKSVIFTDAPPSVAEAMLPALFKMCEERKQISNRDSESVWIAQSEECETQRMPEEKK